MKRRRLYTSLAVGAVVFFASLTASAAMVKQMGLSELVGNADKVFRGTVLTKEPGSVKAGGAELNTVVYTIRVDDALKGDFGQGKDAQVIEITMLGNMKSEAPVGGAQRLFSLNANPDLRVGGDYVLFTTTPSAVGLSTTVGLDQGLFSVFANASGSDMTANGLGNRGTFGGPVSYDALKAAVQAEMD